MLRWALRDARGAIIGWSVGLSLMVVFTLATFPSFRGDEDLNKLWDEFPDEMKQFFGGAEDITSFEGYLDSQFLSLFPLLLGIFGVLHASRVLAGAEERGRLDLLLSTPLTRDGLAWAQGVAVLVAQAIVVGCVAVVTTISAVVLGEGPAWRVFLAVLDALPAAWTITMVTFLAGAFAHRRGPAAVVGTVFVVVSFLLGGVAPTSDAVGFLKYASISWHYQQSDWLAGGPDLLYVFLGLGLTVAFLAGAVAVFRHKDLTG